jgi:predicted transcriptional regulator
LFYTPSHINFRTVEDKKTMGESATSPNYIELCADIVSAYVSNNSVPAADLPSLLQAVYAALTRTAQGQQEEPKAELVPAVSVRKSITPDAIICLEDGKSFKSLKRHLRTTYDMTPEQYRAKWNLPADYPMVAPNYAKARSELAKTMGLGQQRKKGKAPVETATEAAAPAKGRRTKKAA